ncbi:MAG TPA: methyltransferase domain-containing protein [Candidatus Paceibacterota bacterium]|nr:methyltransferase domain-containing protein [Candidatus Paceibacterota bacterium]
MVTGPGGFLDTRKVVAALGVTPGMHVADLGCGSGYFSIELARAVGPTGSVAAVDVMQEPLQSVMTKSEAQGLGNIRTIRADLEVAGSTQIADRTLDLSLLANILFQSQKKDTIIREAVRILKPGGRLVIMDWKKGAVGFGPSDDFRTTKEEFQQLAEEQGATFDREVDGGPYYIVLIFTKP